MKEKEKIVYDFSEAVKELPDNLTPAELADNLRAAALRCAKPTNKAEHILKMQVTVMDVCAVLDAIIVKEEEQ